MSFAGGQKGVVTGELHPLGFEGDVVKDSDVYRCSNGQCPMAQVDIPSRSATEWGFQCPTCHAPLVAGADEDPTDTRGSSFPGGFDPASLPTYLAVPATALLTEPHPRVKLHWLVDTAEVAVRWSVAVALTEVVHAHGGGLPPAVADQIRAHIERPTLGRWLAILSALSEARPEKPVLCAGVFELCLEAFLPRFREERDDGTGGSMESSFLVLRNQLAHGGGISTGRSQELLAKHLPGLEELLYSVITAMEGIQVVALVNGAARQLIGAEPIQCAVPGPLADREDGPWLVGASMALPLWPLVDFGPVRLIDRDGRLRDRPGGAAVQIYTRGGAQRLVYSPLGRGEARSEVLDVARFRELFRLDERRPSRASAAGTGGFAWDGFLSEARVLSEDLVGRVRELREIKEWLRSRRPREDDRPRVGWLSGRPGVGKSMVMARLATDYSNSSPQKRGLFYHRFRGGDARNSRQAFLTALQAALWAWRPLAEATSAPSDAVCEDEDLEEDIRSRLDAIAALPPASSLESAPAFWVFADGLDEVFATDSQLPGLLQSLAVPGTIWLLSGRPDHGLDDMFTQPHCERLFEDGLPSMGPDDVRAMLLVGLGSARHTLLKRDVDEDGRVRNDFIERVVDRAAGLPLYVHLLLEDLCSGQLSIHDEDKLPAKLEAYFDEILDRSGLSTVKHDLQELVCLLACADEPLDTDAVTILLAGDPEDAARYRGRAEDAILAGRTLLRQAPTKDKTLGWTLYHQFLRDHVGGARSGTSQGFTSPHSKLSGVIQDAQKLLVRMALAWGHLPPGNLRNHLFRCGNLYALEWGGDAGEIAVRDRLTSFAYLMARMTALPGTEISSLVSEYEDLMSHIADEVCLGKLRCWRNFFFVHGHVLRRGHSRWPVSKIMDQLVCEHARDSVVRQARATVADIVDELGIPYSITRPEPFLGQTKSFRGALVGHCDIVRHLLPRDDGTLVTASDDGGLALWNVDSADQIWFGGPQDGYIGGILELPGVAFVTWSGQEIQLWELDTGSRLSTLRGHEFFVEGVLRTRGGDLVSWDSGGTLRHWRLHGGKDDGVIMKDQGAVWDVHLMSSGEIVCQGSQGVFTVDPDSGNVLGRTDASENVWFLEMGIERLFRVPALDEGDEDDRILESRSLPKLQLVGEPARLKGKVEMLERLSSNRIAVFTDDYQLNFYDGDLALQQTCSTAPTLGWITSAFSSERVGTLLFHKGPHVSSISALDREPQYLYRLGGDIPGAVGRTEEGLVYVSSGEWQHLIDPNTTEILGKVRTGGLADVGTYLPGRMIALHTWLGDDYSVRLFSLDVEDDATGRGCHDGPTNHLEYISPTRAVSATGTLNSRTAKVWDTRKGNAVSELAGHRGSIQGLRALPDGRVLTWSADNTLKTWDFESGRCLTTFTNHRGVVTDVMLLEQGLVVSRGTRVFSFYGDTDKAVRIWSIETNKQLGVYQPGRREVDSIETFSGGLLAIVHRVDPELVVWDYLRRKVRKVRLPVSMWKGKKVDDRLLAIWGEDRRVYIVDVRATQIVGVLNRHETHLIDTVVSGDGLVASYASDRRVQLLHCGVDLKHPYGIEHPDVVVGVHAEDDARGVLSWTMGGPILRSSAVDGSLQETIQPPDSPVNMVLLHEMDEITALCEDLTVRSHRRGDGHWETLTIVSRQNHRANAWIRRNDEGHRTLFWLAKHSFGTEILDPRPHSRVEWQTDRQIQSFSAHDDDPHAVGFGLDDGNIVFLSEWPFP